jgi:exosortase
MTDRTTSEDPRHRWPVQAITLSILFLVTLAWAYGPTLAELIRDWQSDDNYSVGQLVPFAALYLLWQERTALRRCRIRPCWWGLPIIIVAQGGLAFGLLFMFQSAERYALVLTVIGLVLLVAGKDVFRQVGWILLFLFLMVPLPGRIHNMVSGPLQSQATAGAVYILEVLGITVTREGHVLVLNHSVPVAVAEACSGLRMLTAFVMVGSVMAYVFARPFWQKCVLVLSTVPVAIACNLIRLVVTAMLFLYTSSETAERFFHDFAGWTMMPIAIGLLLLELWVMGKLVVSGEPLRRHAAAHAVRQPT